MFRRSPAKRNQKRTRSRTRLGLYASVVPAARLEMLSAARAASISAGSLLLSKLAGAALLLMSLWILVTLFRSPYFRVDEILVEGGRLVQRAEVEDVLSDSPKSIFQINPDEAARRVQQEFGLLERASVVCKLPNHVRVSLVERDAALIWSSGGQAWCISARGEVLGRIREASAARYAEELLTIRDINGFAPDPKGRIIKVPWALALEVRQALPSVKTFDYSSEAGLIFYVTNGGWPVYLGHEGDGRAKVALVQSLVDQLVASRASVEYIDLRNERRPTFKKR